MLAELWRDEILPKNVADRVQVPKNAPVARRERVVLTDAELEAFMACPDVGAELHTMALASRTLGGARTCELHAWDWAHVDTAGWVDARVPRPKTKSGDRMLLPEVLVPVLRAWWDSHGRPAAGPIFPCRRGARAGQYRPARQSTAHSTFHSFRRACNTALADANVQTAMRLAGHRKASTHMRYVMRTGRLASPTAALLPLLANSGSGRVQEPSAPSGSDAEAQSSNGTPTVGQSAVFSPYLELAFDRVLAELSVGHEGLEPKKTDPRSDRRKNIGKNPRSGGA